MTSGVVKRERRELVSKKQANHPTNLLDSFQKRQPVSLCDAQVELETQSGCETSTNRGFDTCRTKRGRREGAALNGFLSPITFSSSFPFFYTGPCLSCEGW